MSILDLVFTIKYHSVPSRCIVEGVKHHRRPSGVKTCNSQAARFGRLALEIFKSFSDSLQTKRQNPVTKDKAVSLSLHRDEFLVSGLGADCETFSVSVDEF
jgi:hypothetical protein